MVKQQNALAEIINYKQFTNPLPSPEGAQGALAKV